MPRQEQKTEITPLASKFYIGHALFTGNLRRHDSNTHEGSLSTVYAITRASLPEQTWPATHFLSRL